MTLVPAEKNNHGRDYSEHLTIHIKQFKLQASLILFLNLSNICPDYTFSADTRVKRPVLDTHFLQTF